MLSTFGARSFYAAAPTLWKSLLANIWEITSLSILQQVILSNNGTGAWSILYFQYLVLLIFLIILHSYCIFIYFFKFMKTAFDHFSVKRRYIK